MPSMARTAQLSSSTASPPTQVSSIGLTSCGWSTNARSVGPARKNARGGGGFIRADGKRREGVIYDDSSDEVHNHAGKGSDNINDSDCDGTFDDSDIVDAVAATFTMTIIKTMAMTMKTMLLLLTMMLMMLMVMLMIMVLVVIIIII